MTHSMTRHTPLPLGATVPGVPWLSFALLSAFLIVVFPLRALRRRSLFGAAGPVERGGPRPLAWKVADTLFLVGVALALAGPALQGLGALDPVFAPSGMLQVVAVVLTGSATALAIWAQETMGRAWRTDIAPAEGGGLVVSGPFAVVRNPAYVAMSLAVLGSLLLAPNIAALGGWLLMLVSVATTARAEEPQLAATYGQSYRDYAARVGRFLPLTGRLRS